MKLTEQELRENFERWAQTQFETPIDFFHEWQGNCYLNDEFDAMWEGFQACYAMMQDTVKQFEEKLSKLEAFKLKVEQAEVVGYYDTQYKDFSRVGRVGWEELIIKPE